MKINEEELIRDWDTWVKHQVDFAKTMLDSLRERKPSGTRLEFIDFKPLPLKELPAIKSLRELFDWPASQFYKTNELASDYENTCAATMLLGVKITNLKCD